MTKWRYLFFVSISSSCQMKLPRFRELLPWWGLNGATAHAPTPSAFWVLPLLQPLGPGVCWTQVSCSAVSSRALHDRLGPFRSGQVRRRLLCPSWEGWWTGPSMFCPASQPSLSLLHRLLNTHWGLRHDNGMGSKLSYTHLILPRIRALFGHWGFALEQAWLNLHWDESSL